MRSTRYAALVLALTVGAAALTTWSVGTATAQPEAAAPAARIATIDIYSLAERMMNREGLTQPRTAIDEKYRPQVQQIEQSIQDLNTRLQQLEQTPSDPQVRPLLEQRETKFQEYQAVVQQVQTEKEALNASQLGAVYREIREAAAAYAQRQGYTHVVSNRSIERAPEATTVGDALQDILARPMLVSPPGDDITAAIAGILNVDLSQPAAPAAQDVQPQQPAAQAPAPSQTPPPPAPQLPPPPR